MDPKFTVVRKLGQGGFGNVFLVKNSKNEYQVIKSVPLKTFTKYVLSEFDILKSLDHPRIIKFIDFFPSTHDYNFLMEYAPNGTLRQLISRYQVKKWKFSRQDLAEIFMDIAYGVRYLHSKKIIHRDIKPENILLVDGYRAKLADFGVSKIVHDCIPDVHTSIGTLSYMSPEVYLQKPYDMSCDIWALGLIFYEMGAMKYPFNQVDKARILNPLLTFECPKVCWVLRNYDYRCQEVLEMMLQRNPKKRRSIFTVCSHPVFSDTFKTLENEYAVYKSTSEGSKNKRASVGRAF